MIDFRQRHPVNPTEVDERFPDVELVEDGRLLGHVSDARPRNAQPTVAGRSTEHGRDAIVQGLQADETGQEGGFPAPAGTQQAVTAKNSA